MTTTNNTVSTPVNCDEVFTALETWIKQRPGLDPANYGLHPEQRMYASAEQNASARQAYRQEIRQIGNDRARAMKALDEARALVPQRPEVLKDAFRAFSGRLEWIPEPCNSIGVTTGLEPAHLEYCTGQYFPTEYRKAAAAVLEAYVSGWRQAYATEHPRTFEYKTMEDVIAANRAIGNHWFDRNTMAGFRCKIESGLIAGKRFITSERQDDQHPRLYTVREAQPDGTIDTVGNFQAYRTRDQARKHVLDHPEDGQ